MFVEVIDGLGYKVMVNSSNVSFYITNPEKIGSSHVVFNNGLRLEVKHTYAELIQLFNKTIVLQ